MNLDQLMKDHIFVLNKIVIIISNFIEFKYITLTMDYKRLPSKPFLQR